MTRPGASTHCNSSKHRELIESFGGHKTHAYEHYRGKKSKYNYTVGDFKFRTFMDLEDAVLEFQSHGCALCGAKERYKDGAEGRGQGKNYRDFELDHDHLMFDGTLGSCRGYLCRGCNGFLKPYDQQTDLTERTEYVKEWYGKKVIKYLTDPPFQRVLKKADRKFYGIMLENNWDPTWWMNGA